MSVNVNRVIELLNRGGEIQWDFALAMFVQVSLLIVVLLILDVILLRRLRASVRYSLWMLVLVKLMLPVSLHSPVSVSRWMPALQPQAEVASIPQMEPVQDVVPVGTAEARLISTSPIQRPTLTVAPPHHAKNRKQFDDHAPESRDGKIASSSPSPVASVTQETSQPAGATSDEPALLHLRWSAYVLLGWIAVVLVLMTMFVRRAWLVRKIVTASSAAPDELDSLLAECLQLTGVSARRVRLRVSDALGSPAICGFWRGTILLPSALLEKLDRRQMRSILVHELVHWRRFDLQVNCLQTLLLIVYFYNPLLWAANVILRRSREQAVDEAVLATLDAPGEDYSTTLLDIAALSRSPAELTLRLVGVVESRKALSGRIKRILSRPNHRTARLGITGLLAVLIAGLVLLPMAGSSEPQVIAENVVASDAERNDTPEAPQAPSDKTSNERNSAIAVEEKKPLTPEEAEEAEEAGIVLIGQITDETGNPVTDATVEVIPARGGGAFRSKTDEFGFYLIN